MKEKKLNLSLNKDSIKNLRVKTNLKGGMVSNLAIACCTKTHHCSLFLNQAALVSNPVVKS